MTRQPMQRTFKDPVCGMQISHNTATEELVYKGRNYHFCAPTCKDTFAAAREKYIKRHRQHGMQPD